MKKIPLLLYAALLSSNVIAQKNDVNIDFKVEGIKLSYEKASVRFITNKDTTEVSIEDGKLSIPSAILKKRVTVIFLVDNYWLRFDSIPITVNLRSPKWTIGVDEKPFDKKKLWMIKSWKKIQIVYYLYNDDGRMFTVDSYKKSFVIRKHNQLITKINSP
jgi:hypothetical protein